MVAYNTTAVRSNNYEPKTTSKMCPGLRVTKMNIPGYLIALSSLSGIMVPTFSDCQISPNFLVFFSFSSISANPRNKLFFSVNTASTPVNVGMQYSVLIRGRTYTVELWQLKLLIKKYLWTKSR